MSDDVMTADGARAVLAQHDARRSTWRQVAERDGGFLPDAEVVAAMRHEARMALGILAMAEARDYLRCGHLVAPTVAEQRQLAAEGGRWEALLSHGGRYYGSGDADHPDTPAGLAARPGTRWWALDADDLRRPWPVVGGAK